MSQIQFTNVNRVLAKLHRDLKGTELNESDVIEWVGEALDFLKVPQIQTQAVAFLEVKNYETVIPDGFQMVLQIARHNDWSPQKKEECVLPIKEIQQELVEDENCSMCELPKTPLDCNGKPLFEDDCPSYIPYFDMQWQYIPWTSTSYYKEKYTPVRLANHTFFNTLVCKEKNNSPYSNECIEDEYTIVGEVDKKLRFSFEEGYIALAYIKTAMDKETGYPLVPDNISYVTAITYYIKWKIAEMHDWNGREGWSVKADKAEQKWSKYARQGKNFMKMPKSIDDFQDLLEQSHYLIPRHKRYYGFFGNLGRSEYRGFNDPDNRRRLTFSNYGEKYK